MDHRRQAGRATGSALLLLIMLGALGGWNYHRNWQIEQESTGAKRPYEGYSSKDLESLRSAYESELATMRIRFDAAKRRRTRPKGDQGSIAGNVDQFAKTARTSGMIRDAASGVAEREGQIAELDRELSLRTEFGQGVMRHVKRLTTI